MYLFLIQYIIIIIITISVSYTHYHNPSNLIDTEHISVVADVLISLNLQRADVTMSEFHIYHIISVKAIPFFLNSRQVKRGFPRLKQTASPIGSHFLRERPHSGAPGPVWSAELCLRPRWHRCGRCRRNTATSSPCRLAF